MDLIILAGAYRERYELGGWAINSLSLIDGAADINIKFSNPNQENGGIPLS